MFFQFFLIQLNLLGKDDKPLNSKFIREGLTAAISIEVSYQIPLISQLFSFFIFLIKQT